MTAASPPRTPRRAPARGLVFYGVALTAVLVATAIKYLLDPLLGGQVPFILYLGAVVLSAWAGGVGPGLFATASSGLLAAAIFAPPASSQLAQVIRLGIFLGEGVMISLLAGGLRSARDRLAAELEQRRAAQERLSESEARLRETADVLDTVNRTGRQLVAELDPERLVQAVTDAAVQASGAKFGAFFYNTVDEVGESYTLYTLSGAPREAFARFPLPRKTAVFGPTFKGEAPVRLDDVRKDPRYGANPPYHGMPAGHLPVASYLAVPVVSRSGDVLGGLLFGHPETGVFTERAERVVSGLAAQAAIALDNARLLERERRAREAAEAATRLKDDFLSVLSHELRTPLTAILNWLRALRHGGDAERMAHGLASMERAARAQSRLIEDLLDVSRIVTGRLRLDLRPVDVRETIRSAAEMLSPTAEAKGVTLRLTLPDDPQCVAGDPTRLQQVAWNLLSNAVKFTPRGGHVAIAVTPDPNGVRIVVEDSGCGIPADFLARVFDRFAHRESPATRREGGLGLGLAIVRHLVELHGGTVHAASDGDGRGATFSVTLPAPAGALPSGAVPGTGAPRLGGEGT